MDDLLADSVDKMFAALSTPEAIRRIEDSADADNLWAQIDAAGFVDALVAEQYGGAGLTLHEVFPLLCAAGRHALPLPFGATMWARSLLAARRIAAPQGAIAIAGSAAQRGDGSVHLRALPFGRVASAVVVNIDAAAWLLPLQSARRDTTGVFRSLQAHVAWLQWPDDAICLGDALPCREIGATLWSAMLAGALDKVLQISLAFANERVQFGRPIGKFQAIQQQLAEVAEAVQAALMAAEMAAAAGLPSTGSLPAALAKARTSAAVGQVAAISHAVHGAMGITAEYQLQLWTRRLHEWRLDFGAESYWQQRIGRDLLASDQRALDFIRSAFEPVAAS